MRWGILLSKRPGVNRPTFALSRASSTRVPESGRVRHMSQLILLSAMECGEVYRDGTD